MTQYQREESNVTVWVLDLEAEKNECVNVDIKRREADSDADKERLPNGGSFEGGPWGIVRMPDGGIYALCEEGVGPDKALYPGDHLTLSFYPRFEPSAEERVDGKNGWFSTIPTVNCRLSYEEVLERATKKGVPLENFIRTFGARLEGNFHNWVRHINGHEARVSA